ncbi:MAG: ABC transporter ATP-binding protein [Lachnospiraceae bacterium]
MFEIRNVTKQFDGVPAVLNMNASIQDNEVYGLVGTNGAGKSTLLRMMAGVLKADEGEILYNGQPVYENPEVKNKICFLSDSWYTPIGASPEDMAKTYETYYPDFDSKRFFSMLEKIGLDRKRRIRTFSKGMKKQVSVLLGVCTNTEVLLCDETFDGLDPLMRQAVKSIFAGEMSDRTFTTVIASHNLRELEDFCDEAGMMYKGGILFSRNLADMKLGLQKIQCVITDPEKKNAMIAKLSVVRREDKGSMTTLVVRGREEEVKQIVDEADPVFAELLPLSLEEIFINESEVAGYDIRNLFS